MDGSRKKRSRRSRRAWRRSGERRAGNAAQGVERGCLTRSCSTKVSPRRRARAYECSSVLRHHTPRFGDSRSIRTDSFSVQATRPLSLANAPTGSSPTSPNLPLPPLPAVPSHPTCACDILVDVPCFLLTVILSLLCLFHRRVQMRVNAEDAARPILPSTV